MINPSGDRPHLIMLPGMMCNHQLWDHMVDDLSQHAQLHFGDLSSGTTINEIAENVLADAPEKFILCGFSMGGFVAREIIRLTPDRVSALILINTSAKGTSVEDIKRRRDFISLIKDKPFKGITASNLKQSVHFTLAGDKNLLGHIQSMAIALGKDVFMRQLALQRSDDHRSLSTITCPTLVLAARDDQLRTMAESQALADGIPQARLVVFDECGHMTPLEQPKALNNVLVDWLKHV